MIKAHVMQASEKQGMLLPIREYVAMHAPTRKD